MNENALGRAGALACLLLSACASGAYHTNVVYSAPAAGADAQPFRTGQIVIAESAGPHSLLFGLSTSAFFPFTHAGVIRVDETTGEPWVYDMAAEFRPRFARTPQAALVGGIRRQPLFAYMAGYLYAEVYDPPAAVNRAAMAAHLDQLWRRGVRFDAGWDSDEPDRLFCTELVADVLAAGGAPRPTPVPLTANPSLRTVLQWFGVPDRDVLPAALFGQLPGMQRVAAFSAWRSETAARAYLAAKRELHRRFTPDQRIGNLVGLEGSSLFVRPAVAQLLDAAPRLCESQGHPSGATIDAAVSSLAARTFAETP